MRRVSKKIFSLCIFIIAVAVPQSASIDLSGFWDSAHHWYDINDEVSKIIFPQPDKPRYTKEQVREIADNILLYQRLNGGWPKNYDMSAILTPAQKKILEDNKNDISYTTFDNGATHSQVMYLAQAYTLLHDEKYKDACLHGIAYILSAQYGNGGWPQFFPDTSGYRKYITFNDGAMVGILRVLYDIVYRYPSFSFVDSSTRAEADSAFQRGIRCILACQIDVEGVATVWCQQHDNIDLHPQNARKFEPASLCSQESAEIVLLLMEIPSPSRSVVRSINDAVSWFHRSELHGIRIDIVKAPFEHFKYHDAGFDKVVVHDPQAPPLWARFYEIETNRPLFCNRDGVPVYSLKEVSRERRTGYGWYGYEPAEVLKKYEKWRAIHSPHRDVLKD